MSTVASSRKQQAPTLAQRARNRRAQVTLMTFLDATASLHFATSQHDFTTSHEHASYFSTVLSESTVSLLS